MKVKSLNKKLIFILPIIALLIVSMLFQNNGNTRTSNLNKYYAQQVGITLLFPVPENIARGNKLLYGLTDGDDVYHADGAIFSWYGPRPRPTAGASDPHPGIDIGDTGMQVVAAQMGTVIYSGYLEGFGYHVKIQHSGGYITGYSHMTGNLLVSDGQKVQSGQPLGFVGDSGISSGPHLDFRVFTDSTPDNEHTVDPAQFFNMDLSSKTGVIPTGELYNPANGGSSQGGNSGGGKKNTIKLTPQAWAYYASYATRPVEAATESSSTVTGGTSGTPGSGTGATSPGNVDKTVEYDGKQIRIVSPAYPLSEETCNSISQLDAETSSQFYVMQAAYKKIHGEDADFFILSGYRSYQTQEGLYAAEKNPGETAPPGASEHQAGLAIDVNMVNDDFATAEIREMPFAIFLAEHAHEYGFIVRYSYEPWHIRYVGVSLATKLKQENKTLEEFFGV